MFTSAKDAYDRGTKASGSTRELEAAALFKAARFFEACRQNWDAADRPQRLEEALRYNQRLWTLFQTELARTDHELPVELRANLLRLSAFVDRQTFEVMARPEAAKLQSLININRQIAEGLSGRPT
jgi:flagellar protein FlaF